MDIFDALRHLNENEERELLNILLNTLEAYFTYTNREYPPRNCVLFVPEYHNKTEVEHQDKVYTFKYGIKQFEDITFEPSEHNQVSVYVHDKYDIVILLKDE